MVTWAPDAEVLLDQQAWHGVLCLRAWHWAASRSGQFKGLALPGYRAATLAAWMGAFLLPWLPLAVRRWQAARHRDEYQALLHRQRSGKIFWSSLAGTALCLFWPLPLLPIVKPLWAGGVLAALWIVI